MKMLLIVLCLLTERYVPQLERLRHKDWFSQALSLFKTQFPSASPTVTLLGLLLPILLLLWILTHVLGVIAGGALLLQAVLLFFCLGPMSFLPEAPLQQDMTAEFYFEQANRQFFGLLFWYLVLGIAGALIYRLLDLFSKTDHSLIATQIMGYVDWLPARLTGILFLLVGHFDKGYEFMIKHLPTGVDENTAFLIGCGTQATQEGVSLAQARQLVWHAMILYLVGILGLTLAALW